MSDQSTKPNKDKADIGRFKSLIDDLKRQYSDSSTEDITLLLVSIAGQKLYLLKNQKLHSSYSISTAEAGIGNQLGSYQTPLGTHQIAEKFGDNAPISSIFRARKNTQLIAKTIHNPNTRSNADNITSRILWLTGLEEGVNKGLDRKGNNVDSCSRYIYIHGTDEEGLLGRPASHGCIRMANQEIIELFDTVKNGDIVAIVKS